MGRFRQGSFQDVIKTNRHHSVWTTEALPHSGLPAKNRLLGGSVSRGKIASNEPIILQRHLFAYCVVGSFDTESYWLSGS